MVDAELIDDLNRFADLAARLSGPLHRIANQVDLAGDFRQAFRVHQRAGQIQEAGQVARDQARELVWISRVPAPTGETAGGG